MTLPPDGFEPLALALHKAAPVTLLIGALLVAVITALIDPELQTPTRTANGRRIEHEESQRVAEAKR
jgi:hypothetical protein